MLCALECANRPRADILDFFLIIESVSSCLNMDADVATAGADEVRSFINGDGNWTGRASEARKPSTDFLIRRGGGGGGNSNDLFVLFELLLLCSSGGGDLVDITEIINGLALGME